MSRFFKYHHVERFGHSEVTGITDGTCHVFPKLDGTNASVWLQDGELRAGSRRRELTTSADNYGFCAWVKDQDSMIKPLHRFLHAYPECHLFGEWLVPHTIKTYRDEAWRRFYIFDVMIIHPRDKVVTIIDAQTGEEHDELFGPPPDYVPYDVYQPLLEEFGLDYVPRLAIVQDATKEQFLTIAERNDFLMQPGEIGEGIVIKNYDFVNQFGHVTWAKIVRSEFHEKNMKEWKSPIVQGPSQVEKEIAEECVTKTLVEKERAKIESDVSDVLAGGKSKPIQPRLLGMVWYAVIQEELWTQLKRRRNPTIDFKKLNHRVILRTKQFAPDLFGG